MHVPTNQRHGPKWPWHVTQTCAENDLEIWEEEGGRGAVRQGRVVGRMVHNEHEMSASALTWLKTCHDERVR